jgi:pyruvate formate lyase activating enzyme
MLSRRARQLRKSPFWLPHSGCYYIIEFMQNNLIQEHSGYIFDIKRYAIHDGPGIRTTVFFKGCPLRCLWCHNPESWKNNPELSLRFSRCIGCGRCAEICPQNAITMVDNHPVTDIEKCNLCGECIDVCLTGAREIIGSQVTVSQVMAEVEKDRVFYDQSGGGVTFSGGEPLYQHKFLLALLDECSSAGIHSAVDTTCYAKSDIIQKVAEKTDMFLCDIKHMDPQIHKEYTGVDNSLILENIRYLAQAGANIKIRIPVIPGFNDDDKNIEMTAQFVKSLDTVEQVDILPYNSGGLEKAARLADDFEIMKKVAPNNGEMENIKKNLQEFGFKVTVGG